MTDDGFDDFIKKAAQEYQAPTQVPRDEIWARIQAARKAEADRPTPVVDLASRRRPVWIAGIGIAAVLLLGIGIGRWTLPEMTDPRPDAQPVTAATPVNAADEARGEMMVKLAAVEHLGQVDALLTDYQTGATATDFRNSARGLLAHTRLLLGSKRLTDSTIKKLLSDLELLLVQVAQIGPDGHGDDRALIDDNLAEQAIRPRVRNAIRTQPGLTI